MYRSSIRKIKIIINQRNLSNLYTWYMDPPLYGMRDANSFLKHIDETHGSFESFLLKQNFYSFDYMTFLYYQVCFSGWDFIDYSSDGIEETPEDLSFDSLYFICSKYKYVPTWIPAFKACKSVSLTKAAFPEVVMLYHMDRWL